MSGPKSVSYVVESAAEIEARERRQLAARFADLAAREAQLVARARAEREQHGPVIDVPEPVAGTISTSGDIGRLRRGVSELAAKLPDGEARLARQVGQANTAEIAGALSFGAERTTRSAGDALAARPRGAATPEPEGPSREQLAADVERLLSRLSGNVGQTAVARVRAAAEAAAQAWGESAARLALDSLRSEVQRANEDAEREASRVAALDALHDELAGVSGLAADELRALIEAAREIGGEATDELGDRVRQVLEADRREADRRFAAATVESCLADLGYEVAESFDTVLVRDGFADVRRPEWRGYAVRIRAGADNKLGFNVVRGPAGEAARTRDVEVEEEWCGKLPDLLSEMRARGLGASVVRRAAAGQLPVQVVEGLEALAQATTAERTRPALRSAEL